MIVAVHGETPCRIAWRYAHFVLRKLESAA
jgi:hypothetical protein